MEKDNSIENIRKRLHACLDRMLIKDFDPLTPEQLIQYQLSHQEDKIRIRDYIERLCSPERQEAINQGFENLRQELLHGDY